MMGETKRIPERAGFRRPDGKCRWCGVALPNKRWTFCSDECVHQHKLRTQPTYQADHVFQRDRGICCQCGLDTEAVRVELREAARADWRNKLLGGFGYECIKWSRRPHTEHSCRPRNCRHEVCVDAANYVEHEISSHKMGPLHAAVVSKYQVPEHLKSARRRHLGDGPHRARHRRRRGLRARESQDALLGVSQD